MPRIARCVAPGYPHHVTQRGARRLMTFFRPDDYGLYIRLLAEQCALRGVCVWAYCLMPNHVHLIVVPGTEEGLAMAVGEAHRRFAVIVNQRKGWRGHLWQSRFGSVVLDETHLWNAVLYVELNPVRAGLVERAEDWPWSSARAHLSGGPDPLVDADALSTRWPDWATLLARELTERELSLLRLHERTGRPLGSESFLRRLEQETGRSLRPGRPGRPRKGSEAS